MKKRFRVLFVAALAAVLYVVVVPTASANDAVANVCAVEADVTVAIDAHPYLGVYLVDLECGQGVSDVIWATVRDTPFYIQVRGTAPKCYQAGTLYFPNNGGYEETTKITPTRRCTSPKIPIFSGR